MNETPQALALKALRAINKSSSAALQLDDVPKELLAGSNIDLHRWTMLLKDKNLKLLSEQKWDENRYLMEADSDNLIGIFKNFWFPNNAIKGLLSLNISNAKEVTDYGITLIARSSPNLKKLNMSGCSGITDTGLREIGMNCPNMLELIISGCHGLQGSGLISLAECCHQLLKLDASKCVNLQNWSLTKIFYDCTNIEEVDVSYLKVVGDEEIRVLAQNCANLTVLRAIECHYISDASVLVISNHCADLDYLDISRTNMAFRVTDVCMMALGQRCHSLRTLHLNGCDMISDVGITWLSEGCKAIENLELAHCIKITDAGLRNIGSECHALKTIDISHSKNITDVGLASLTQGCPNLTHVNCHGAFMLSDPRLSAPKKGAKLEAWQTLLGIAALANHCPLIESLDLTGCFRLNVAIHEYISKLKFVKRLNLSGCAQATPESLISVAKGCPDLEEINFSNSGKAVSDGVMAAFASNCPKIRSVILSHCLHIRGGSMKAVSNFTKLDKLDISGCKNLTDTMLLYLCEVDKVPLLKTVNFGDCPKLTDSILAWISIKPQNILLIALKGTGVSKKAILSVRDRFPNSDFLHNDNFFGFWPKVRVSDRILLNKYFKLIEGIVKIQSRHRKYKASVRIAGITYARIMKRTQLFIQRVIRGFLGRCRARHMRAKRDLKITSANKIISIFRICVAKKRALRKRRERERKRRQYLAIRIQVRWRMHRDKKRLEERKRAWQRYQDKRARAVTKIQSMGRRYFAVNKVHRIKVMIRAKNELHNHKATIIQNIFRMHVAIVVTNKFKAMRDYLLRNQNRAAVCLQRFVRARKTNNIVATRRAIFYKMMRSVVMIQSVMRGALARLRYAEIMTEIMERKRLAAAVRIQGRVRVIFAKNEFSRLMKDRLRRRRNFDSAATRICNAARVKLARLRVSRKRDDWKLGVRKRALLEIASAVKIQALTRGVLGRHKFEESLRVKKGKWKELFDEQKQKRFFYNKLTGEVRYRIPQDLLDLVPHPVCDNCNRVDATLECSVCNELFCSTCFNHVHAGGRRREHTFRALYDYYGRRLDYGDGVFPSMWPSEVMQDEMQGWMLRVAPIRKATVTYNCGWEMYQSNEGGIYSETAHRHSKSVHEFDNSRQFTFYFNRNTFETSYNVPKEVSNELAQLQVTQELGHFDDTGQWVTSDFLAIPAAYSVPTRNNTAESLDVFDDFNYGTADHNITESWNMAGAVSNRDIVSANDTWQTAYNRNDHNPDFELQREMNTREAMNYLSSTPGEQLFGDPIVGNAANQSYQPWPLQEHPPQQQQQQPFVDTNSNTPLTSSREGMSMHVPNLQKRSRKKRVQLSPDDY